MLHSRAMENRIFPLVNWYLQVCCVQVLVVMW